MLLRDHYYSANKWRIVEIKKFSIGAGTTAVLVPKRLCLIVSSRSVRQQPEKLGRRWWKVWNKVLPSDRCWQSAVLVDQVCQRHQWVVPGIAARYREELCSSVVCIERNHIQVAGLEPWVHFSDRRVKAKFGKLWTRLRYNYNDAIRSYITFLPCRSLQRIHCLRRSPPWSQLNPLCP